MRARNVNTNRRAGGVSPRILFVERIRGLTPPARLGRVLLLLPGLRGGRGEPAVADVVRVVVDDAAADPLLEERHLGPVDVVLLVVALHAEAFEAAHALLEQRLRLLGGFV